MGVPKVWILSSPLIIIPYWHWVWARGQTDKRNCPGGWKQRRRKTRGASRHMSTTQQRTWRKRITRSLHQLILLPPRSWEAPLWALSRGASLHRRARTWSWRRGAYLHRRWTWQRRAGTQTSRRQAGATTIRWRSSKMMRWRIQRRALSPAVMGRMRTGRRTSQRSRSRRTLSRRTCHKRMDG